MSVTFIIVRVVNALMLLGIIAAIAIFRSVATDMPRPHRLLSSIVMAMILVVVIIDFTFIIYRFVYPANRDNLLRIPSRAVQENQRVIDEIVDKRLNQVVPKIVEREIDTKINDLQQTHKELQSK